MGDFGTYEFGLSAQEEARAAALHDESIVVDMLFQGPTSYHSFTDDMVKQLETSYDEHRDAFRLFGESVSSPLLLALSGEFPYRELWDLSGVTAGTFETITGPDDSALASFGMNAARFDRFSWLRKALEANDFRSAKASGGHAAWINCQIPAVMPKPLSHFDTLWANGLRMYQLAYNVANAMASGCTESQDIGVTDFGRTVVRRLNDLGVIVDTSHCGERTTLDACRLSSKPVVASHTSAGALYDHPRAKSDEELRALAGTGGIIGIYAVPDFLDSTEVVTVERMLDNVDYVADLVGWEHVGIGADWPLAAPKFVLQTVARPMDQSLGFPEGANEDDTWERNVVGFDDYRDYPNITRGLVKRGYRDEQIKAILGENFLRVFGQVCG